MLTALLWLTALPSFVLANSLTLGSIKGLSEQEVGSLLLPQIYQRIGVHLDIMPLPASRAEHYVRKGQIDGEVMRIYEYGDMNKLLIRVPTSYYSVQTTAFFRRDKKINLQTLADLASYSLVRIKGVKNTELITQGMSRVAEEYDTKSLMELVNGNFADIALTNKVNGLLTLEKMGEKSIVHHPLILGNLEVFHYLHVKHKHLMPIIDRQIKTMKASGELQRLIEQAEAKVITGYRSSRKVSKQ